MLSFTKTGGLFSRSNSSRTPRQTSRASLGLEILEERQLMSTFSFTNKKHLDNQNRLHMPLVAAQIQKAQDLNILLTGTANGSWTSQSSIGTTTYSLVGSGVISPLQTVALTGTIAHRLGQAHDTGTLILSTPPNSATQGTLTLTSVAVQGSLTNPSGEQFQYTAKGTGAFASMTGSGTFTLSLTQSSQGHGQFKVAFNVVTFNRA
jgi:hypothetical protein